MNQKLQPLAGIRVLDFTAVPPGGACTTLLADLGADVVRIESPALKGKPSTIFGQVAISRGKRSITLDQRNPAAPEILARLAASADVVVENARPGVMEKRGFGYSHARAGNTGIIWCAMTGFGQDGPYANHGGHDLNYTAHSGLLGALTSDRDWHPGISMALQAGALSAVVAIEGALIQRGRTGEGAFIDLSFSESATWFVGCGMNPMSESPFAIPVSPDRRLYVCADGRHLAIACSEPRNWAALCEGLGVPELVEQLHKWTDAAAVTRQLSDIFVTRTAIEWVDLLAPSGAAVTVVNHGAQVCDDPHVQARGSVVEVAGVPVPASPIRIAAPDGSQTCTATSEPHNVGDDTVDVLLEAGFSSDEVEGLGKDGVV
ncbi:MAG: CaiB/BaiF CoA-transferase family protein [Novosphingobium sp.]|nr:CaiB/BaiF CoA-transferase family protein [Novosphingobium sp.]